MVVRLKLVRQSGKFNNSVFALTHLAGLKESLKFRKIRELISVATRGLKNHAATRELPREKSFYEFMGSMLNLYLIAFLWHMHIRKSQAADAFRQRRHRLQFAVHQENVFELVRIVPAHEIEQIAAVGVGAHAV